MESFLRFVHDDYVFCKYYEALYILFHTGLRISEFCGHTEDDIDLKKALMDIKDFFSTIRMAFRLFPCIGNTGYSA